MFDVILACDTKFGIGINGKLPWSCPEELRLFREKTMGGVLIVGRKTAETLPKLDNRIIITLSTTEAGPIGYSDHVVASFSSALELARKLYADKKIFVAGGGEVYRSAMNFLRHIDTIHISRMKVNNFPCDTFFKIYDYLSVSEWDSEEVEFKEFIHATLRRKNKGEQQYLDLVSEILRSGEKRVGRNGETRSLFGRNLIFDLRDGFPLLTTKRMFFRGIVEELLFFIRGETDSKILEEKGVNIWKGNTSREFLDKNEMEYRREGIMGPLYGYQWRFFNAEYEEETGKPKSKGIDQLKSVIDTIRTDPSSRRILLTDFNPEQASQGVLYPCHSIIIQFYVSEGFLDAFCYNRSQDVFLGTPFNIASSALLLTLIAKVSGLTPRFLHLGLGDVHIYQPHYALAEEQTRRKAFQFPRLEITKSINMNMDNTYLQYLESLQYSDLVLLDYKSRPGIKAEMIA